MYKILFPNEPFDSRNVDSSYLEEFNICKILGIDTLLFDYDKFIENGTLSSNLKLDGECVVIYRGWMMKPLQYTQFYDKIIEKSNGKIKLINNPTQYQNCHCFPYIYDDIKNYTPRIIKVGSYNVVDEYEYILENISFDFFIKDYVKSIKTENGVERINKNISCVDLLHKVDYFISERGNLFTDGIILKEFVNLKKTNDLTNEWRVFVVKGSLVCLVQNSNLKTRVCPPSTLITEVIDILKVKSDFFTVDFAELEDGSWTVIETGDGQVSGFPVDFNPIGFYNNLK